MSLLSAHDLHKSFGAHALLDGVSLTITAGERLGLVGNNGSGKSTLAKILGGVEVPDTGEVMRQRGVRIATLAQVPNHDPEKSAFDTVALGLSEWQAAKRRYDELLTELALGAEASSAALSEQANLGARIEQLGGWDPEHQIRTLLEHLSVPDPQAKVGLLSGGEQRRVALAQQLLAQPDLLILDEPTNHLDTETSDWLESWLAQQYKGALLLITHDRYFLDRLVRTTLELAHGKLSRYDGGWQSYLEGKADREALDSRSEANRQNFLRSEIEWLRRQPKARGTKQKARTDRAHEALDQTARGTGGSVQLALASERQGSNVLSFEGVTLEIGGRQLVHNLDLILVPKQRVGIIGRNGAGKTSLLRAVTGELSPSSGCLKLGKNTRIAYFDQTRSGLDEGRTIAENVCQDVLSGGPAAVGNTTVRFGDADVSLYSYLGRFLFRSEEIHKPVSMLSGGERARVALAKLLLQRTNLLLLDEPTNDLDVTTLGALEEMLLGFGGSVLVVTHDRYFLNRVATDILAFEGDGRVEHVVGNYDSYKALRPASGWRSASNSLDTTASASGRSGNRDATADDATSTKPTTTLTAVGGRAPKLTYNETRELEGMLDAIDGLETRVGQLEAELSDPNLYKNNATRAGELQTSLGGVRAELETKVARWEELEQKREAFEHSR